MTDLPDVKLRALVNFPVRVTGGPGIGIEKDNGEYTVGLDVSDLIQNNNISTDEVDQSRMIIWNEVTDSYETVPYSLAVTAGVASIDGHTGALDIGIALEFAGDTLDVSLATQAQSIAGTNNTTVITPLRQKQYAQAAVNEATPFQFGLNGTSVFSQDAAAPIRAAMLALSTQTYPGKLFLPPGYRYALRTQDAEAVAGAVSYAIRPYSNVSIVGDGPTSELFIPDGFISTNPFFSGIYPPNDTTDYPINDVGFKNFKFNGNGLNNAGFYHQNTPIAIRAGNNIRFEGLTFENCGGTQIISVGIASEPPSVTDLFLINNVVVDTGFTVNSAIADHSSFYWVADRVICTGNSLHNPASTTLAVNCALEIHGSYQVIANNLVNGYSRFANVAAEISNATRITIANNICSNLREGIVGFSAPGFGIDDVEIVGNSFGVNAMNVGPIIEFASHIDGTSNLGKLIVNGNRFTDDEAAGLSAGIYPAIQVGSFSDIDIIGNSGFNLSGGLVNIPYLSDGSVGNLRASSLRILQNYARNCGQTSDASYQTIIKCLIAAVPKSVEIGGNTIINAVKGIDINMPSCGGGRLHYDDIMVDVTTPYTVASISGMEPTGVNAATPVAPVGTGVGNKVQNTHPYRVMICQTGGVDLRIIDRNGATTSVGNASTIILQPLEYLWANTTAPTSWAAIGL